MKHTIHLLEDDDYDLNDDVEPEYDFAALRERARKEGREYKGILSGKVVRLEPEVAAVFSTSEAVNEALRTLIRVMKAPATDDDERKTA